MKSGRRRSAREATVEPGPIQRVLAKDEVDGWVERWMAVYGRDSAGVNARAYLWHIFSAGRFPSVDADDALRAYEAAAAAEYIVLSNDRTLALVTGVKPLRCSLSDWVVFPPTLSWTMAFTHEVGWLGPYFAHHPDHARLVDADRAALGARAELERAERRKRLELDRARKSGWAD